MATLETELVPPVTRPRKATRNTVLIVLLLGVTATALWFRARQRESGAASVTKAAERPIVRSVVHLESFVVNLADPGGTCFLRVGIDLGISREPRNRDPEEASLPVARIRDTIITVLTGWTSDSLLAAGGKEQLKTALLSALQARVSELGIEDVYFTDFLVQR
jgi:flagellar protein FliL